MKALTADLDMLVQSIQAVPSQQKYWLIRTQSGSLYSTFKENNYLSIDHSEVSLDFLQKQIGLYKTNEKLVINEIKAKIETFHVKDESPLDKRSVSFIASQIVRFAYEVNVGDIVIIPSYNSNLISFGVIERENWCDSNYNEKRDPAILKKSVRWVKEIRRNELDPYLIRMFTAHQAINNVSSYAEIIERSINDLFILDDEAHFVINVGAENVSFKDLFGLGCDLMKLFDEIALKYDLQLSSNDFQVSVNINSPGKIDIKSKIPSGTALFAVILLFCGGGYEAPDGTKISTDGLPGIVKSVDEFLNHQQERNLKQEIFTTYKDSLKIKAPEDLLLLLKQVSENKDVAK